jgi:hypothetical protein
MRPQPELSTQEVLAGLVERVTYHNSENGFCVLARQSQRHKHEAESNPGPITFGILGKHEKVE